MARYEGNISEISLNMIWEIIRYHPKALYSIESTSSRLY